MKQRVVVALSLVLVLLMGCNKDAGAPAGAQSTSKFLGAWVAYMDKQNLSGFAIQCNPDGTLVMQLKDPQLIGAILEMHGQWREEPGKLFLNPKDMDIIGKFYGDAKNRQDIIKGYSRVLHLGEEKMNVVTWTSDTSFTADENGSKMVYNRKT